MKSLDIMASFVSPYTDNPCAFGTHSCNRKTLRVCFHWITVQIWKEVYEMTFRFEMISSSDSTPIPTILTFGAPGSLLRENQKFDLILPPCLTQKTFSSFSRKIMRRENGKNFSDLFFLFEFN